MKLIFHSDGKTERKGYLLNFTLLSLSSFSNGKWYYKEADKTCRVLLPRGGSRGQVQRRSLLLRIKFVFFTSQLRHSLVVHLLLRKILDPLLPPSGRLLGSLLPLIVSYLPGKRRSLLSVVIFDTPKESFVIDCYILQPKLSKVIGRQCVTCSKFESSFDMRVIVSIHWDIDISPSL